MEFSDYQKVIHQTAVYPGQGATNGLCYTILGLTGEAGELANKAKKILRGDYEIHTIRDEMVKELGDVLWYIFAVSEELNIDIDVVAEMNAKKLLDRKDRGVLKGSGDNR